MSGSLPFSLSPGFDLQSELDKANATALGPMYAPRDPSFSGAAPATIGAGVGMPFSLAVPSSPPALRGEVSAVPGLTPPEPPAPGASSRVSTRVPTAKGADLPIDPHETADYSVGRESSRASEAAYANNAAEFRSDAFPDLPVKGLRNPENISQAAVDHMADNLVWLHNTMVDTHGQEMVDRASKWYDGANAMANRYAGQYGYYPEQVAGAMANLSPRSTEGRPLRKWPLEFRRPVRSSEVTIGAICGWAAGGLATSETGWSLPT